MIVSYPKTPKSNSKLIYLGGVTAGSTWQDEVISRIKTTLENFPFHVDIVDTRRKDWPKGPPSATDAYRHGTWENIHLKKSDYVFLAFTGESTSVMPIAELVAFLCNSKSSDVVIYVDPSYKYKDQVKQLLKTHFYSTFEPYSDFDTAIKKFEILFKNTY